VNWETILTGTAALEATRAAGAVEDLDERMDTIAGGLAEVAQAVRSLKQPGEATKPVLINAGTLVHDETVASFDEFVGQVKLKHQLRVHIESAKARFLPLEHTLLASGMPGVGKTTLARLIAKEMGMKLNMLVPPFAAESLYQMVLSMDVNEILFIDEIHKLADHGPAAAENLLHLMEEGRLYLSDGVHEIEGITLIGATTDPDKLPETITDRFFIKPYFEPYTGPDMVRIVANFARKLNVTVPAETMVGLALASRRTPRVARELVLATRDLTLWLERPPTAEEVLSFKDIEPDGTTRQHKAYLIAMYKFFGRENNKGMTEYVAGEASLMSLLRETRQGLGRLERFLIERGYLDRTPRGRRLTTLGVGVAQRYVSTGG
jgi:Holliday junction DNA helicase RuvB